MTHSGSKPTKREVRTDFEALYDERFGGKEDYRRGVWRVLMSDFFQRYVQGCRAVLDLGSGYGEFINQVQAPACYAIDLNPAAGRRLKPTVEWLRQDSSQPWPLPDNTLDLVFTSNFLEHLPDDPSLHATLREAYRCLRRGGRLIALGPNINYAGARYWDIPDHYLALSDESLGTSLRAVGFTLERVIPRFLPFTMSDGRRYPLFMVRLYLRLPIAWRFLGYQFLVVATKTSAIEP